MLYTQMESTASDIVFHMELTIEYTLTCREYILKHVTFQRQLSLSKQQNMAYNKK